VRLKDLEILDLNEEKDVLDDKHSNEDDVLKEDEVLLNESENITKKRKKKNNDEDELDWKSELKSILYTIVFTVVLVFLLKTYVVINATVPTGSMENTILPGDNIMGLRISYLFEEPERGDVIFFYFPDDESQKYVKRIIGMPGEKVTITDAKIYINDSEVPLDEPYLKEEWIGGIGPYEFQVPDGCYFVLGDNRNASADARYWQNPYVAKEKIIGKAIFTYYPIDRWGLVE
jgi:signal peptidase I